MKPTAILTSDLHLREDTPVCRIDDFWQTQAEKINWLADLQKKYDCPIIDAGDLFNKWRGSYYLARWAILNLPYKLYTLNGNHDTPYHNLELHEKSILGVLEADKTINILHEGGADLDAFELYAFPWGSKLHGLEMQHVRPQVALMHIMTYKGRNPWPGCTALGALDLLKQMEGYDLVVTGHNHKTFVVEHEGRLLVNPGSLSRQTVDQIDHKPCVFLWYAEDNHVEQVFVPIQDNVISKEHIEKEEDKENRINVFVERLSGDFEIGLSFEKNLEEFFLKNRIRSGVKNIIQKAMENA